MAQAATRKLDAGDPFPDLHVKILNSADTTIRSELGGSWSILLFYRGHW